MGTLPTSGAPVVAIVGSRKPSAYGREVTEQLASDLATVFSTCFLGRRPFLKITGLLLNTKIYSEMY